MQATINLCLCPQCINIVGVINELIVSFNY